MRAFVMCLLVMSVSTPLQSAENAASFFITSNGPGQGADLGGLEGADAHCQQLAASAGVGGKTWRAYLSSSRENARDRIGMGPWHNIKGVMIASDLAGLHSEANGINKETGLTEQGEMVNGRGDSPNMHDILTGSNPDGTLNEGQTCSDWTSSDEGSAFVGHHDRIGLRDDAPSRSWNASHSSRGCGLEALKATGGNGLFYCFAID
ncbi:hypothetical protein [Sedimenticola selenatireducens]|uniref:hypothetical protein n=2 Tax=Sedimenticola selenatireducens TaxID=191960 RepID=UPI000687C950|nr:hypothetical protein [Sedimenticola selenatireducens]